MYRCELGTSEDWYKAWRWLDEHQNLREEAAGGISDRRLLDRLNTASPEQLKALAWRHWDRHNNEHSPPRELGRSCARALISYVQRWQEHYAERLLLEGDVEEFDVAQGRHTWRPFPLPDSLLRLPPKDGQPAAAGIVRAGFDVGGALDSRLEVRWHDIKASPRVRWRRKEPALNWALDEDRQIRIGFSPLLQPDDLESERIPAADDKNNPFLRFKGIKPRRKKRIHARLDEVLQAAARDNVNVLLFPELAIDPMLRNHLVSRLRTIGDSQLKLIVAGSGHEDVDDTEYCNRCYVYSGLGTPLWRQDKLRRFQLEGKDKCREPSQLGDEINLVDSPVLGRLITLICADYCNADGPTGETKTHKALRNCLASSILVPALQADGQLRHFEIQARTLAKSHWAASLICNVLTDKNGGAENSCLACLIDTHTELPKISRSRHCEHLQLLDVFSLSSQELVKYRLEA